MLHLALHSIEAEVPEMMEANLDGWRQGNVDMIMATFHPT